MPSKKKLTPVPDTTAMLKILNGKWAREKSLELEKCYNGLADVCSKYPSIVAVTALELVKTQIVFDKLNHDNEPNAVNHDHLEKGKV